MNGLLGAGNFHAGRGVKMLDKVDSFFKTKVI